jgi:phospholipase/carboxylesterase
MKTKLILLLLMSFTWGCAQKVNTTLTYLVNQPAKKTEKVPVLIMLHGYGSNEEDLFDLAKSLDPRFMTFSLRGNFSGSDGGYCWYKLNFMPNYL